MAGGSEVNVLLDTCALIALPAGALPSAAARALRAASEALISTVSAWEIAIKARSGKLSLPIATHPWLSRLCQHHRLRELSLDSALACAAAELPLLHRDPFDRVLIASAQRHQLVILTSDKTIPKYPGIQTIWR
jgi:PIN domain nuclease of toxin-antitoxin system